MFVVVTGLVGGSRCCCSCYCCDYTAIYVCLLLSFVLLCWTFLSFRCFVGLLVAAVAVIVSLLLPLLIFLVMEKV